MLNLLTKSSFDISLMLKLTYVVILLLSYIIVIRKDSLEGSLDRVLLAAELKFPKQLLLKTG